MASRYISEHTKSVFKKQKTEAVERLSKVNSLWLKNLLAEKELSVEGTKVEMADRLYEAMPAEERRVASDMAKKEMAAQARRRKTRKREQGLAFDTEACRQTRMRRERKVEEAGDSQTLITDVDQRPVNHTDFDSIFNW